MIDLMAPKVYIMDYPVLATGSVQWNLRSGVRPVEQSFDLRPDDAKELLEKFKKRPVSLTIILNNLKLEIKYLYIIYNEPAENKNIVRIRLADRRWLWSYVHIYKKYNIRRNIGFKRATSPDTPFLLSDIVPKFWYAKWSMKSIGEKDVKPWEAKEVLEDILNDVLFKEQEYIGVKAEIKYIDGEPPSQLPIEQLIVDTNGENAIEQVLNYLPEMNLYVDYDGTVIIYKKTTGNEKKLVDELNFEIVGRGHIEKVDFSIIRPSKINFYFTREVELRFDYIEPKSKFDTTPEIDSDTRTLDNVLPLPDYQLTFGDVVKCQGTYVEFQEVLNAWGNPLKFPKPLDYNIIRKCFIPYNNMWAGFYELGQMSPDGEWSSRIAAIENHFRQTFRIKRQWMDRIQALKDYRLVTVDVASGQRSPAVVYAQWGYYNDTERPFYVGAYFSEEQPYWSNEPGYPIDGKLENATRSAPARVSIVDNDQGIIHIEWTMAYCPLRRHSGILPGHVIYEGEVVSYDEIPPIGGPRGNIKQKDIPCAFNGIGAKVNGDYTSYSVIGSQPMLNPNWRLIVILTAIPAGVNTRSLEQFHKITITPKDVKDIIGIDLSDTCLGPEMDIHIGPQIEVARIGWKDDKAEEIEKIFKPELGTPNLEGLVLNETTTNERGASLNAIAKAYAAKIYGNLIDRYIGSASGYFNPDLKIKGWSEDITHIVMQSGECVSQINLPERIQPIDILAYLPASARALILHLAVNPDKK